MPGQKFNFTGMDTDSSDLTIAPDSARLLVNVRVGGSKDGHQNANENVQGNTVRKSRYVSTQSFTIACGFGLFGPDVTVNYTYTSFISQVDADTVALARATAEATAALVCSVIAPDWQFDLTTIRCKTVMGANTGEREAKKKDLAVGSATEGQYQNSGEYFVYDTNTTECPIVYPYPFYERHGSKPDACGMSTTPVVYYSDSPTLIVGTRLYTDTALTVEILSGYYKRGDYNGVVGYTPGVGNGVDSFLDC